ncbi:hypothetical protein OFM39_28040, partial [Escherichia coli]|nr:hypothetical protein [Escherichia coli]
MAYNRTRKERAISFRVTEEQWQEIAQAAAAKGECPTDWCRDLALAEAQKKASVMTAEGRLLLEELARVRYLVGN